MYKLQGHPCIIEIKEVYTSMKKARLNIVMEFGDGGDLQKMIKERAKTENYFSQEEILNIFTYICLGLQYIHENKIIHRDLTTSNIFVF